jgi:hypothetical protein
VRTSTSVICEDGVAWLWWKFLSWQSLFGLGGGGFVRASVKAGRDGLLVLFMIGSYHVRVLGPRSGLVLLCRELLYHFQLSDNAVRAAFATLDSGVFAPGHLRS